jgi:serine/threonine protein kinase
MPPLLQEGQIVRNHRIVRRIGTGGMGEVYEAVHQTLQRRVAIKVLHPDWCKSPDLVKRFFNEALAANLIRHSSMVAIHDHGQFPDGMPFLIMEFLEGESLRRHFGLLEPLQVARLGWQIATGLSAAHKKKIIHRDLKPDNIMLLRDDTVPGGQRVKILDFGLAKLQAEHQQEGAQPVSTRDGVALGTPEYMAPEQWLGAARVDGKADVYSLGVVLFETLSGTAPFVAQSSDKLRAAHLYESPPPLKERRADTPSTFVTLIEDMLKKTQAERPSMADVATRLGILLEEHNVPTPNPSMMSPAAPAAPAPPSAAPAPPSVAPAVPASQRSILTSVFNRPKDGTGNVSTLRIGLAAAAGFFLASLLFFVFLLLRR